MYASNQALATRPVYLAKTWFWVCDVKGGLSETKCVSYHGSRYANVSFLPHTSARWGGSIWEVDGKTWNARGRGGRVGWRVGGLLMTMTVLAVGCCGSARGILGQAFLP